MFNRVNSLFFVYYPEVLLCDVSLDELPFFFNVSNSLTLPILSPTIMVQWKMVVNLTG